MTRRAGNAIWWRPWWWREFWSHARSWRRRELCSKLATARALNEETLHSTLSEMLDVAAADEDELYEAMDWLQPRQERIARALAKQHLSEGTLVLYDLTSVYFEGRHCPLAKLGHSRDDKGGKLQIVV